MTIKLNQSEIEELMTPVNGSGGFQSLILHLQERVNRDTGELVLSEETLARLLRCMMEHGSGGYQSRLRRIFARPLGD